MYYEVNVDHSKRLQRSVLFNKNAAKLQKRERYVGMVTDGVKKRMKKCITLLLQSTPYIWKTNPITGKHFQHKVSFITLTTPDHDLSRDNKFCVKHLLEPFLRDCRRKFGMKSYIWKCELQSNGQVHYHVTTDFIAHHQDIKNEWNKRLRERGMLNDFKDEYDHDDPNSTDIHAVYKVNNLEAYLVKYICKEYQNEVALNGKVWDASKNLKAADYFKLHIDEPINNFIRGLQRSLMVFTSFFERAIFLDFKTNDYYAYFSTNVISEFSQFLNAVRDGINLKPWINPKSAMPVLCKQPTPAAVPAQPHQSLQTLLPFAQRPPW